MRFYGGNSKRIIKKHADFGFDGVYYRWEAAMFRMRLIAKLKPGDKIWIPYIKEWGTVQSVEFHRRELRNYRRIKPRYAKEKYDDQKIVGHRDLARPVNGWYLDEPLIIAVGKEYDHDGKKGSIYYVYDIEHWNQEGATEEEMKAFNLQVGLSPDYKPDYEPWY